MPSVDSRIVTMKFDNAQFEHGVATTMSTMDKLKQSLGFQGATKGLDEIGNGVSKLSAGFIALSSVAITALANITNRAVDAGIQLVKSLSLDQVMAGFKEYELKLGAIQTIMAGSGESLDVVNQKLQELNEYSDKTIYSFSDMTQNIGKFTNAGISLDKSVAAIKGVANVAALSGANAEEASRAMYNFAQALSSGSVRLQDWKSIELANMATKEFKQQLIDSAVAAGTLTKSADGMYKTLEGTPVSATKGFNESLTDQWLTTEALTTTLERYSDETTDVGKRATAAAQDVKTFTQLMSTLKESMGSGWAQTFEIIFGNFDEAKELWTSVNNVLGGLIGKSAEARNKLLSDWKALGGRTDLIEGLKNIFSALGDVIKPIKEAFRDIFPALTGKQLAEFTKSFKNFTASLKISGETAENLKRTFAGVFAIFSIVGQVLKGIIGVIAKVAGAIFGASSGFLGITGGIGDFLVAIDKALKKGDALGEFFRGLGNILVVPIQFLKMIGQMIGDIFSGFNGGAANAMDSSVGRVAERLKSFGDALQDAFHNMGSFFEGVQRRLQPLVDFFKKAMGELWDGLKQVFNTGNFNTLLDTINTGLFGALVLAIKKFLSGGLFGASGFGGMIENISGAFEALTGSLQAMQTNIKSKTLMNIAIAVGILAASLVAIALIDSAKLTAAMAAITGLFIELMGAMKILEMITAGKGLQKIPVITAGMIMLATAILILSHAVQNLAELSWEELARGLTGVAGILAILVVATKPLAANSAGMIRAGAGILILGFALKVLASALADFGNITWGDMAHGMIGIAGALLVISGVMRTMPNMGSSAAGILVLSVALKILASAITDFAALDWGAITRGLVTLGASLVIVAGAMRLMPQNMLVTAASLVVVSVALKILASAIQDMGGMSWGEIAKGLVTLAGSLVILAGGLYLMTGTLAGAAALLVASAALVALAAVLKILGSMSWVDIIKGLVALAAVFVVLGAAGYLLSPVVPMILALGAAVMMMGVAMLAAGVGILAFATAITMLAALGTAAAGVITAMLMAIIASIPAFLASVAQGIVEFAKTLGEGASVIAEAMGKIISAIVKKIAEKTPEIVAAFITMISGLLTAANTLIPQFGQLAVTIILTFLAAVRRTVPAIVQTGLDVLFAFINGIGNNIYRIVTAATRVITEFIRALGDNAPKVMDEGAKTVIKFINGLTTAINNHAGEVRAAGGRLAVAIIDGMTGGLASGVGQIASKAKEVANSALNAAKSALGISSPSKEFMEIGKLVDEGFAAGIVAYSKIVDTSVDDMGTSAVDTMKQTLSDMSAAVSGDVDLSPVITPVLDLTQVQRDANAISALIQSNAVTPGVSYNQAALISANQLADQTAALTKEAPVPVTQVNFEQNNISPKALSTVEIYRQTRNQLSLAKEALNA